MPQVLIRNIDERVMERLRARAAERRQSLEQTLREVLAEAAKPSRAERIDEMRRIRAMSPMLPPGAPSAEELIREDRDSR